MLNNLTFDEYLKIINPENKYFGEVKYKITTHEMNCDRQLPPNSIEITSFSIKNCLFKILEINLDQVEHIVINNNKEVVSMTDDEFGALMIKTASEYQSIGIGRELLYQHLKSNPFRNTGGLTDQGYALYKSVFRRIVDENLSNGAYKEISSARLSEILTSTY